MKQPLIKDILIDKLPEEFSTKQALEIWVGLPGKRKSTYRNLRRVLNVLLREGKIVRVYKGYWRKTFSTNVNDVDQEWEEYVKTKILQGKYREHFKNGQGE